MIFFKSLYRFSREYKLTMLAVSTLMAVVALSEGLVIALVIPLLNLALGGNADQGDQGFLANATPIIQGIFDFFGLRPSLGLILVTIVLIFVVQGLARFLQRHLQWKMIKGYDQSLIHCLFKDYLSASWLFFVNHKAGHLINVLSTETTRAKAAFQFILQALAHFFLILFYLAISFLISWKITLLAILFGSLASTFLKLFIGRMERYGIETSKINNEFQSLAFDMLSSVKMIKSSATEEKALNAVDKITQKRTHLDYISQMSGSLIPSFYFPLVMSMLALLVYIAMGYWQTNFATLLIFLYLFFRLIPTLSAFHSDYEQALIFIPSLDGIDEIQKEAVWEREESGKKIFTHLKESIVFNHIVFGYHQKEDVLKDTTITIKKGESIAVVGASGAGKTSLVDLLLGLLTPSKGTILIDTIPLNAYDIASWRRKVGYLSQDVFLFHDTLRTNLAWIAPHASENDINQAIKAAHADEFISKMPEGLNTIIGDRGVKLSGGQRQRVALARLLLQNPDVIVFDEAMSALDSHSEKLVQKAIATHLKKKTKIIISHRLSSVKKVDRIYVLEKGRIAEEGTWNELINKKGVLASFRHQQTT
ncbi:MAG: ABC transporter ATP-binding protein [Candidatus Portnoybacteria bacterium]|nr:ABC transporter ATP-binding protein [Candidatus Portnoybacteria bacterium]